MTDINHHALEAAASVSGKVTGGSGVGLVLFGGLTANEWGIVAGVLIGLSGLLTQATITWYFKRETLKLEKIRLEHDLRQGNNSGNR